MWIAPETEEPGLVWPGWSTESIPAADTADGVRWTLKRAQGPGEMVLYTSVPNGFGVQEVRFSTHDGITSADSFVIDKGVHAHGTWAFTAEGLQCLEFDRSTTLSSGKKVSETFTVAFAVGRTDVMQADPKACWPAAPDPDPVPDPDLVPVATRITAATVTQTYGKAGKLAVSVSPNATGQVMVKAGSRTVRGALSNGKATVILPKKVFKPGVRSVTISYAGASGTFKPATARATVKVVKAKPRVLVKRAKGTAKRGKTATFRVTVSASGVKPGGKVTVKIAGKSKTVKLNSNGRATVKVRLGKKVKLGKKAVSVTYRGDKHVAKGKTKTTIRAIR